jgi:hypothetical protein
MKIEEEERGSVNVISRFILQQQQQQCKRRRRRVIADIVINAYLSTVLLQRTKLPFYQHHQTHEKMERAKLRHVTLLCTQ